MLKFFDCINFINQFLIVMFNMVDLMFLGMVVYFCDYSECGVFGFVINCFIDIDFELLFNCIDLKFDIELLLYIFVYFGGLVQIECGFVLYELVEGVSYNLLMFVDGGFEMMMLKDVFEVVVMGIGLKCFLLMFGYVGWGVGQFEEEIFCNGWLMVVVDLCIVFDMLVEECFEVVFGLFGVSLLMLFGEVGYV